MLLEGGGVDRRLGTGRKEVEGQHLRSLVARWRKMSGNGTIDATFGPIIRFSPSYGKRGPDGAKQWTHGWHTCAGWVWGDDWALEVRPGISMWERIVIARGESPFAERPHALAGWQECVAYCAERQATGTPEELLAHDLRAIVDTFWESKQAKRPTMGGRDAPFSPKQHRPSFGSKRPHRPSSEE